MLPTSTSLQPMNALTALHTRCSISQLTEPGPNAEQLENIVKAGLRANDHAHLRPWRFLLIEGAARHKFGDLFVQIKKHEQADISEEEQSKLAAKPLRAPLIITVIAKIQQHDKVPEIEQIISAGCAAQLMMVAAHAQGIGAVWRTGNIAYDQGIHQGLGLNKDEKIIGFLYMGTAKQQKSAIELASHEFIEKWLK